MNAEFLRITIDIRLWKLFLETIQVIAEILVIDLDELLKRILTNPEAEHLFNLFSENRLKEAGY